MRETSPLIAPRSDSAVARDTFAASRPMTCQSDAKFHRTSHRTFRRATHRTLHRSRAVMAPAVMARVVMAQVVMAQVVMAEVVMAEVVMAQVVMAQVVMADPRTASEKKGGPRRRVVLGSALAVGMCRGLRRNQPARRSNERPPVACRAAGIFFSECSFEFGGRCLMAWGTELPQYRR